MATAVRDELTALSLSVGASDHSSELPLMEAVEAPAKVGTAKDSARALRRQDGPRRIVRRERFRGQTDSPAKPGNAWDDARIMLPSRHTTRALSCTRDGATDASAGA